MNAVNALRNDMREDEFAAAVAAANRWTEIARPLIQASIEMDRVAFDLVTSPLSKLEGDKSFMFLRDDAAKEARRIIEGVVGDLDPIIESLRDNFLADHSKSWTSDLSEEDGDAVDEWNDALSEEVVKVADFVKVVEREDHEQFLGRAA